MTPHPLGMCSVPAASLPPGIHHLGPVCKSRHKPSVKLVDQQVYSYKAHKFFLLGRFGVLHKQWSCVGRWWCFQLGTKPWGCAPRRRMWAGSSGTSGSPGSLESPWMPSSYRGTHQAGGRGEAKESFTFTFVLNQYSGALVSICWL